MRWRSFWGSDCWAVRCNVVGHVHGYVALGIKGKRREGDNTLALTLPGADRTYVARRLANNA